MRIVSELDDGGERPGGTVAWNGSRTAFSGWIELLRVLEAALHGRMARVAPDTTRDFPGANETDADQRGEMTAPVAAARHRA